VIETIEMSVFDRFRKLEEVLKKLKVEWSLHKYRQAIEDEKEVEIDELIQDTRKAMYTLRKALIKTYGHK
jgi:hypothetical protein